MKCPSCGFGDSKVIDSRLTDEKKSIRRRRECEKCQQRFTTFERLQGTNLMVKKENKILEPYDREKVLKGVIIACGKRAISFEDIHREIMKLEEIWAKHEVVETKTIGDDVLNLLKKIDPVAYIRFASIYKEFKNPETFRQEFEHLLQMKD